VNHPIFTLGHSNHTVEGFLRMLGRHGVSLVADVRSQPFSRLHPQFNRGLVESVLWKEGIRYAFLGGELGARTQDSSCYVQGKVQYERLAASDAFQRGLGWVEMNSRSEKIALICSEREPLACHRCILVARHLHARGLRVLHILNESAVEEHEATMERLLAELGMEEPDLFRSREEVISLAYEVQGQRIAFEKQEDQINSEIGARV